MQAASLTMGGPNPRIEKSPFRDPTFAEVRGWGISADPSM